MSDTPHQLTDAERKLLEDCPRSDISEAVESKHCETFIVIRWMNGYTCILRSLGGEIDDRVYIPRAAVEAWLAEQDEREAEKQRRIAKFVTRYKNYLDCGCHNWFWEDDSFIKDDFHNIDEDGDAWYSRHHLLNPSKTIPIPRAELEAALRAAGVEPPVTISPELRARLEKPFELWIEEFIYRSTWPGGVVCTEAQAKAFLAEKGVKP